MISASLLDPETSASGLRAVTARTGYSYLISLPPAHARNAAQRWPLLVFLHGTAGWGSDVWGVTVHGLPRLLPGAPALPGEPELTETDAALGRAVAARFIIVTPQCPYYEVWEETTVLGLVDAVASEHNVDSTRVYLTGLSMGGFGTWSVGIRHPERFAALLPICGGGRLADIGAAARDRRAALQSLGVWAFHGGCDDVVPAEESARMIDGLRQAGVRDVRLTVYPEAQHDSWSATYANRAIYDWLLQHRRDL